MKKPIILLLLTTYVSALFSNTSVKLYGFIRNDFYYNSRLNEEGIDGIFHFFPTPANWNDLTGKDENAIPQTNMLSISSRIGLNITGQPILNATTSGKIEADFAGFGVANYVLRIRQAFLQLKWKKSSILLGQTWHPLWGSVMPTCLSLNAGMPFNPFNRSPQFRFTYYLQEDLSMTGAAVYQMQYSSNGPQGFSPDYMRKSLIPNLFGGIEKRSKHWITGGGIDFKVIKPEEKNLASFSAMAYSQYRKSKFTTKAKVTIGQNLSDQLLASGYGRTYDSMTEEYGYTNLNIFTSWINVLYGKKWQVGVLGGYSQNLGSEKPLYIDNNQISVYGRGFYFDSQEMNNRMLRIAPSLSYHLPNLTFGIEYNLTNVQYGTIQPDGKINQPYTVSNHRIIGSASYYF